MSRYGIKDVFLTLQGEGARAGTKALFVRFSGCNLWNGNPVNRDQGDGACAKWCDTDFFKGSVMALEDLLAKMEAAWPRDGEERWCVLTGGEPCLQIDADLLDALHGEGWKVAVETNGTEENEAVRAKADWICIAPKLGRDGQPLPLSMPRADELKVVLPGAAPGEPGWTTAAMLAIQKVALETLECDTLFVQPQDPIVSPNFVEETSLKRTRPIEDDQLALLEKQFDLSVQKCIAWVLAYPKWRLSLQAHKFIGVP